VLIEPAVRADIVDEAAAAIPEVVKKHVVDADALAATIPSSTGGLDKQFPESLQDHEIASCRPLMGTTALAALAKSIQEQTQLTPIHTYEGKILDGRNRYRACKIAGIDPVVHHYLGDDPVGFAIASNRERRHETMSQRAMIAAKIANLKHGSNQHRSETSEDVSSAPTQVYTIDRAAAAFQVAPFRIWPR
jgi:hypothetical protein